VTAGVIKAALGTCRSARSALWRPASISVRAHGETKTEQPPRTLALPAAAVQALRALQES